MDNILRRYTVEENEKWREIGPSFPFISFPAGWSVQIIPPFAGATARFMVRIPGEAHPVSVYADHYNALGYWEGPYWEVYPVRGDVGRCDLADVPELLRMIGDRSPE